HQRHLRNGTGGYVARAVVRVSGHHRSLRCLAGRGSPALRAKPADRVETTGAVLSAMLPSFLYSAAFATGGVPCVWKLSIVLRPQAWPLRRSASVHTTGCQSGSRISRAPAFAISM